MGANNVDNTFGSLHEGEHHASPEITYWNLSRHKRQYYTAVHKMSRARSHSGSTIKAVSSNDEKIAPSITSVPEVGSTIRASLSIHDEAFSREPILFAESYLTASGLLNGTLVEVRQLLETIEVRDFEQKATTVPSHDGSTLGDGGPTSGKASSSMYLCLVKMLPTEQSNKQHNLEISVSKQIANNFGFVSRAQIVITIADKREWTSSHTEISFRDAYLSRSDMWRFVGQELVGKTIYTGQKLSFLNSLKATLRTSTLR